MQLLSIILQKIFYIFLDLFFSEINILFFSKGLSFVFIFFRINTLWLFQTFPFFHFQNDAFTAQLASHTLA